MMNTALKRTTPVLAAVLTAALGVASAQAMPGGHEGMMATNADQDAPANSGMPMADRETSGGMMMQGGRMSHEEMDDDETRPAGPGRGMMGHGMMGKGMMGGGMGRAGGPMMGNKGMMGMARRGMGMMMGKQGDMMARFDLIEARLAKMELLLERLSQR